MRQDTSVVDINQTKREKDFSKKLLINLRLVFDHSLMTIKSNS